MGEKLVALAKIKLCVNGASVAVMIGDHSNDVRAAAGAGIPCIFATWGYGPLAMGTGAAAYADEMAAVPGIADALGRVGRRTFLDVCLSGVAASPPKRSAT